MIGAQASCLWGNRASRLVDRLLGRQDARWPRSQDGCAPFCSANLLAEQPWFHKHESAMAILIDEKNRVLVQGITGREGRARTRLMREYGTNVVAGVTPGKGGQSVLGV